MTATMLASMLGLWSTGKGSLQRKLTAALMDGIRHGSLAPGVRLPSERALAGTLSVSRTTVVAAYDGLHTAGWVERRQGSGTWVRTGSPMVANARSAAQAAALSASPLLGLLVDRESEDVIDLGLGSPLPLDELGAEEFLLPPDEFDALMRERLHYPLGLPVLRQAVAEHFTHEGLPTHTDQVLITNGAQHAIALTAALCLRSGDVALIEDPTYFGAIAAFRWAGARLAALPVRAGGVPPATLQARLRTAAPRLVYLTPACQNPTGTVTTGAARREIARVIATAGTPVIDDRTMADLVYDGPTNPPLASHAVSAPILTIGSLSKLIGPALRIGWIRAPESLIERLARVKATLDLGSPLIAQAVAARLLRLAEKARAIRQRELKERRDHLAALFAEKLPDWEFALPKGGLFLWARLPTGDARQFAQVALRHGVVIVPGPSMSPDEQHARFVRVTFLWDRPTLTVGAARLAAAWKHYSTMRPQVGQPLVMV